MNAKKGDFIEIEYTGIIKENNIIFDTTDESTAKANNLYDKNVNYKPVVVCLGNKEVLPGLDEFLVGKEPGKEYDAEIKAIDAFGEKNPRLLQLINTNKFLKQNIKPIPGLQVNIDNAFGVVKTVSGGRTLVDFNHPLAGKDIIYKVKINKIIADLNEKIKAYLSKALGKNIDFRLEEKKLTICSDTKKELQDMIASSIKEVMPEISNVEFEKQEKSPK